MDIYTSAYNRHRPTPSKSMIAAKLLCFSMINEYKVEFATPDSFNVMQVLQDRKNTVCTLEKCGVQEKVYTENGWTDSVQ